MRDVVFVSFLLLFFLAIAGDTAEAAATPEAALERYERALERSGLDAADQGIYVETLDGTPLLEHNAGALFNPASVVKLATSDVALRNLGPEFRYETRFFADGEIDRETGELRGDLVVVGSGDPSFTIEHAFGIAEALGRSGVSRVTGDLVVTGPLLCNFSEDRRAAGEALASAFDRSHWTGTERQAFARSRPGASPEAFRGVEIRGDVVVGSGRATAHLVPLFTHRSAPLVDILKALNNYSNNWMAHVVGARVGGAGGVERSIEDRYGLERDHVRLETTSGLGRNAMRPRDVVTLLRGMTQSLGAYEPSRVMPVAGVDEGTLDTRLREPGVRRSVVAKTGTLSGVSALAGYMYTRSEGVVLFAIMNRGGSPGAFRPLQDLLVREVLEACGGPAPIAYTRRGWSKALSGLIVSPEMARAAGVRATRNRATRWTAARPAAAAWRQNVLPFLREDRTRWPEWLGTVQALGGPRRDLAVLGA